MNTPSWLVCLLFGLAAGSAAPAFGSCGTATGLPCVHVPSCDSGSSAVSIAAQADGRGQFPAATTVHLCHSPKALHLQYVASDESLFLNRYHGCNTDMWNNEVVELFIAEAKGEALITQYHEVECSPHNDLYVAQITNPFGNGTNKTNQMIDCAQSGIEHNVTLHKPQGRWDAQLRIPWALVTNSTQQLPSEWRINLFRVLMINGSASICDDEQCRYGAWSPTGLFPSNYHVSTKLGTMRLV